MTKTLGQVVNYPARAEKLLMEILVNIQVFKYHLKQECSSKVFCFSFDYASVDHLVIVYGREKVMHRQLAKRAALLKNLACEAVRLIHQTVLQMRD